MGKYYYLVWLFVLILLFGFFSIPKIFDRISSGSIVEDNRSVPAKPLSYLNIDNEPKKVPEFLMFNQDSLLIGNEDFLGKVYIVEFFFTSWMIAWVKSWIVSFPIQLIVIPMARKIVSLLSEPGEVTR